MGKRKIQCPDCKGYPFKDWTDKNRHYCRTCNGQGVILVEDNHIEKENVKIQQS